MDLHDRGQKFVFINVAEKEIKGDEDKSQADPGTVLFEHCFSLRGVEINEIENSTFYRLKQRNFGRGLKNSRLRGGNRRGTVGGAVKTK
jgi:hypothetical protein